MFLAFQVRSVNDGTFENLCCKPFVFASISEQQRKLTKKFLQFLSVQDVISDMEYIYLGVKLPAPRSYERIRIGNINFNENVSILREKFLELYDENNNNFSFSYCGIILDDTEPIKKYNLRSGSTVHVLRKNNDDESKEVPSKFTEMEVQRVTALYRSLNSGNFHVSQQFFLLSSLFSSIFLCYRKFRGRKLQK